jgi:DNA polymerase I-like protein with 3'-5' exonuclease and polymerase domains
MARGVSKYGRSIGPVSRPLEEYFPINFDVVGKRDWIDGAFPEGVLEDSQKIYVSNPSDLVPSIEWLKKQKRLGVDSETTGADKRSGLDPTNPQSRIILLQVGTPDRVLLIQPELIPEFKDVLESREILHLLQNAVYDFKYLLVKYGIHMERMYDTMLAEQLLTSGLLGMGVSLEEICRRHKPHRIISKEIRKQFMTFSGIFDKKMTYYAARDIVLLFPIFTEQAVALQRWKMERVAQDEFDVIPCTAMMELGGVHIDVRVLRLALTYWDAREQELLVEILKVYDQEMQNQGTKSLFLIPGMQEVFDLNSSSKKLHALQSIGFDIDDTKRDTLEEAIDKPGMSEGCKRIAKLLAEYSEVKKITTTYGESMIDRVNPATQRLYPEFNQLGSGDLEAKKGRMKKETIATGRYSSDFQQLPKPVARYAAVTDPEELSEVEVAFLTKLAETKGEVAHV